MSRAMLAGPAATPSTDTRSAISRDQAMAAGRLTSVTALATKSAGAGGCPRGPSAGGGCVHRSISSRMGPGTHTTSLRAAQPRTSGQNRPPATPGPSDMVIVLKSVAENLPGLCAWSPREPTLTATNGLPPRVGNRPHARTDKPNHRARHDLSRLAVEYRDRGIVAKAVPKRGVTTVCRNCAIVAARTPGRPPDVPPPSLATEAWQGLRRA
jgi:hypothetical protein